MMLPTTLPRRADLRNLRVRLLSYWRFKALAGGAISVGFFAAYFILQHVHVFAVHVMPVGPIDEMIGFHPGFTILYVSLWPYMSIVPWLTDDLVQLLRYAKVLCAICLIGLIIFLIWPTAIVRPIGNTDPLFRFLIRFDGTVNACPSLHVTFAVFSALCISDFLCGLRIAASARIVSGLWCAGIVYATLATKQHVFVDVLAAIPLGSAAWLLYRQPIRPAQNEIL
jgi:hypothetical protein